MSLRGQKPEAIQLLPILIGRKFAISNYSKSDFCYSLNSILPHLNHRSANVTFSHLCFGRVHLGRKPKLILYLRPSPLFQPSKLQSLALIQIPNTSTIIVIFSLSPTRIFSYIASTNSISIIFIHHTVLLLAHITNH